MLKKGLVVLCCLSAVSVFSLASWGATLWQLQTKLSNAGGTMQVRNKAVQTVAGSIVYHNFTTSAPVPVSVAANSGYRITALTRSGTAIPIGNYTSHYSTTFQKGINSQSLVASFTAQQLIVTGTVSGPGTISPASTKVAYGGSVIFSSSPSNTTSYLSAVAGGTVADLNGAPVTLPYRGGVKITAGNVTVPRTVTATYTTYSADAGVNQLAMINTPVTLKGSMIGGGSPSWSQLGGPQATLSGANTLTPSFRPSTVGTYLFQLTQSVAGVPLAFATTQVVVVDSLVDDMRTRCMGCHAANGVYQNPYVFNGWSTSRHQRVGISCVTCHTDGAMPTPINSNTVNSNTLAFTSGAGNFCLNGSCHTAGVTHKSAGLYCSGCHSDYRNHNPDTTFTASLGACFSCHGAANSTHFHSMGGLAPADCLLCHSPSGHNPAADPAVTPAHFNGYTSYSNAGYAAAYVTPATRCADCHQEGDPKGGADLAIAKYRSDWAASGHGDVGEASWLNSASHNWKNSGLAGASAKASAGIAQDCQRCHTASGYLQFAQYTSFAPVTASPQRFSEPLTCNACHLDGAFSGTRSFGPRTGYYNYSSLATGRLQVVTIYPETGKSNICLGCHVGRKAGDTIKAMAQATVHKSYSSSFWQDLRFVDSHYLSAGGQVFGVTGYHYPDQPYDNGSIDHTAVGASTAQGPCVACHMPASSHTLAADSAGYALCNGCHQETGTVNSSFITQKRGQFQAALKALGAALTAKGFPPVLDENGAPRYPYFNARNWGGQDDAPGNLGAAFNYNLLAHDPGAFAHNPSYSKRLLRDSIDFLTSGTVDRTRDLSDTIDGLLATPTEREDAAGFFTNAANGAAACRVCHENSMAPQTTSSIFSDYGASKHATRPGGATCLSCHAPGAAVSHPPTAMLTGKPEINAKCLNCHQMHSWDSTGDCTKCHNGHWLKAQLPPPHFANFSTAQYATKNIGCANCHTAQDSQGNSAFVILPAHREWAAGAKGESNSPALTSYDFKTMGTPAPATPANSVGANDCVRCHTTTGYRNYVTSNFTDISPWGVSGLAPQGDRTREMMACPACHSPTPFDAGFSRLTVGIFNEDTGTTDVRSWYNYSSAGTKKIIRSKLFQDAVLTDLADSNICIACHAGRAVGDLIKQTITNPSTGNVTCSNLPSIVCRLGNNIPANGLTGSFWSNVDFVDPHGGLAVNLIYPDNFRPGYDYRQTAWITYHANIDIGTSRGPCVGCHMSSPGKHAFSVLSSASNGVIAAITTDVCARCHGEVAVPLDAAYLQGRKSAYQSALAVIASQLAAKGIFYNRDKAPYFFTKPTAEEQSASTRTVNWYYSATFQGAHLMGAAFNLRLLDSGAGWVHNGRYVRRILHDTIDYLDDGAQNNTVVITVKDQNTLNYIYPRP